jgi:hypothetical protein
MRCTIMLSQCTKKSVGCSLQYCPGELVVKTIIKKTTLSIAAAAAALIAASSASFAAELPSYQAAGFPISPVQAQVLERANVHEQSQAPTSTVSAPQLNEPASRTKMTTATATPVQATGSSLR